MSPIFPRPSPPAPPPPEPTPPPPPPPPAPTPPPLPIVVPPTAVEVSQSGATDMDNKAIKRRRRGRSSTILTGSYGIEEGATLGKPTLLG